MQPKKNKDRDEIEGSISDDQYWRSKIRFLLKIYPGISHSMLQIALGTAVPSRIWKPCLSAMVSEKIVRIDEIQATFDGLIRTRTQVYHKIFLNEEAAEEVVG